jgi:hypothetical protein
MPGLIEDAKEVLLKLRRRRRVLADTLEGIYDDLEAAGKKVLDDNVTDEMASEVLAAIARQEDMNGRIRRNVMDTRRAVSFMMRSKMLNAEQFEEARQILRDIDSLDSHTAFLFDKINFLMDATVGFININQNKIIKIFSVASVALLPPTLIASIYGMNFRTCPSWSPLGYPFALALMVASALVPMLVLPAPRLAEIAPPEPLTRHPPEGDAPCGGGTPATSALAWPAPRPFDLFLPPRWGRLGWGPAAVVQPARLNKIGRWPHKAQSAIYLIVSRNTPPAPPPPAGWPRARRSG